MRATCAAAAIFCFLSVSATAKTKPVKLIVRTDPATGITTVFPSGALARSGLFTSWDIQPREAFDAKGKRSIELLVEVSLLVNGEQYHAFYGQVALNIDGNRVISSAADFLQDGSCDTCLYYNFPLTVAQLQTLASAKKDVYIELIGAGYYSSVTPEMHLRSKDVAKLIALCSAVLGKKTTGP